MVHSASVDVFAAEKSAGMPPVQPVSWQWRRVRRWTLIVVLCVLATAAAVGARRLHAWVNARATPAAPPSIPVLRPVDDTPLRITITAPDWSRIHVTTTVDRLQWDATLWRHMHLGDWDRVPAQPRRAALDAMLRKYRGVLRRSAWTAMSIEDWDVVPQPIRAAAYLRMAHHWAVQRGIGAEFGLSPRQMGQVIGAIIMAESWFEHRSVNENEYGRDLGLAQCSDFCRQGLAEMAARGEIPFDPETIDYFHPLTGSRVAAVWFERELRRAEGDVALAIRAYHRGLDDALDEKGDVYAAKVRRLRDRYVRTQEASETWQYLTRRIVETVDRSSG